MTFLRLFGYLNATLPFLLKVSGVQGLLVLGTVKGKKEEEGKRERKKTYNVTEDQPNIGAEEEKVENEVQKDGKCSGKGEGTVGEKGCWTA